jgi:hypothetical protein
MWSPTAHAQGVEDSDGGDGEVADGTGPGTYGVVGAEQFTEEGDAQDRDQDDQHR